MGSLSSNNQAGEGSAGAALRYLVGGELGDNEKSAEAAQRYLLAQANIDLSKLAPDTAIETKDFNINHLDDIELGGSAEVLPTGEKR